MLKFKELYKNKIKKDLQQKFNYQNIMQIPRIEKISLNMGVGEAVLDNKLIDFAVSDLSHIAGQKAVITKSRKSNAAFKLRENMSIGCRVTLRKDKLYEFLERLVMIALPAVRDFRGFNNKSFDGLGNFSFGIKEQIIFPEINYDKVDKVRGMNITIVTSARSNEEAKELLIGFNLPFNK